MILLDTHILLWLTTENQNLGIRAREMIDHALAADTLHVSAITFWEISMLRSRGRIRINMSAALYRTQLLEAGLLEIPLTGDIGINATRIENFHADPADRFIVATAQYHGLNLMTADQPILEWPGHLDRHNGTI